MRPPNPRTARLLDTVIFYMAVIGIVVFLVKEITSCSA